MHVSFKVHVHVFIGPHHSYFLCTILLALKDIAENIPLSLQPPQAWQENETKFDLSQFCCYAIVWTPTYIEIKQYKIMAKTTLWIMRCVNFNKFINLVNTLGQLTLASTGMIRIILDHIDPFLLNRKEGILLYCYGCLNDKQKENNIIFFILFSEQGEKKLEVCTNQITVHDCGCASND